jgi:signal transduction histidine kinase
MILKEDFGDKLGTEGVAELDRQAGNARKLNALVEELLRISRLSNYDFEPVETEVGPIATKAAEAIGPEARRALSIMTDAPIKADPELLEVALSQLLTNCVRYAEPDRELAIQVFCDGNMIRVSDNGSGFDPERAGKIFVPFERLNRVDPPGAGVGLTIFKRIVDRHGGVTGFESEPGRGTTFWFTLE